MEILDNYLDTMFSRYPLTDKTEEAKRELRAMMEDSYNGALAAGHSPNEALGQAISEFGNIEEVAPLLGLSPKTSGMTGTPAQYETWQSSPWAAPSVSSEAGEPGVAGQWGTAGTWGTRTEFDPAKTQATLREPGVAGQWGTAGTWGTRTEFDPTKTQDTLRESGIAGQRDTAGTQGARTEFDPAKTQATLRESGRRAITLAQAKNYAEVMRRTRWMSGIAVALLVVSPAALIGFAVAFPDDQSPRYALGLIVGFMVLLPLVGVGVGLLVWRGQQLAPFHRITASLDYCTPEVEQFATSLRQEHSGARTRGLIIAIAVWILAAFPILSAGIFTSGWEQERADPLIAIGLVVTELLVAIGLLVFLPSNWADSAATKLLVTSPESVQDEYTEFLTDRYPTWVRAVFSAFWLVITSAYLAWSFPTGDWHLTWIIWPIAAVLFAAFTAVITAVYPPEKPPNN
ncbi:permease prefix domain 1-containing protein [Actinomycetaceae bacterium MB13-C1-2]|nr:permease prefix domain 1-containing protein [Actinomycetaceae bacterium MB13-C1-2]